MVKCVRYQENTHRLWGSVNKLQEPISIEPLLYSIHFRMIYCVRVIMIWNLSYQLLSPLHNFIIEKPKIKLLFCYEILVQ